MSGHDRAGGARVDVLTEVVIARPVDVVSAYAADPAHAPDWYRNIDSVELRTGPGLRPGARAGFVAHFLGRRLEYEYEVVELVPGERLVMRTAQGPFPMETTYTWEPVPGGTRMTLRNSGEPAGFARLGARVLAAQIRRANRQDLEALRRVLEDGLHRGS
ncbi:SRPBCC family protein [uncultured Kocuria sp.]|uniref:SRPBCC family protein n=1 Tax=uncultured Kocuria sp. TaxID=259305 RepID=UPI0026192EDF|nr:SRPBCC family protein [uncultured Kocuria sp.]